MSIQSLSPIMFESVSAVTATPSVELGTRRIDAGNAYIYVYNDGNSQISQGLMGRNPATLSSGYSVTVTNAASGAGGMFVVGVAHNATLTTGTYGWLMTRGVTYAVPDASAISLNSGALLTDGVDGGFVSCIASAQTGVIQAIRLGVALNSFVTAVGTGKILFKSPLYS